MLLDVSRPLGPRTEPWPGDAPFTSAATARLDARGRGANTSSFGCSAHLGTHVDAPWHVLAEGARVDALPLDAFVGPARVVDAMGAASLEPTPALLAALEGTPRPLFRTRAPQEPHALPRGYAALSPGLAEELARRRVRLVGLDAPSADPPDAEGLPAHRALARAGIPILEGLDLARAAPGAYELLALPLRLEGLDASPVRAVLRRA